MDNLKNSINTYKVLLAKGVIDYDKFNSYAIVHHSSAIEGSSLTINETSLLLDEKLTPKNRPIEHVNMALDHFKALQYVLTLAKNKEPLSIAIIQKIASLIVHYKYDETPISIIGGAFYPSKGEFRKCGITAGITTFMDYKKVPQQVASLIDYINNNIIALKGIEAINDMAFNVLFQMVTIHPFADGNGRVSRLLMNYVQHYHNEPLTVVFSEDKIDYYNALEKTRENEDITVFRKFMYKQYEKFLNIEIKRLQPQDKGFTSENGRTFMF